MATPEKYQAREDGDWQRWIKGGVDAATLASKVDPQQDATYINGCQVYALFFPNGRKWNCRYGWAGGML